MKQIIVFMTLIGLLLVNQQLNAQQDVEYFNQKTPRPEEVTLLPTMKNAHKGTNFTFNEVKMAHETGYNSLVPVEVQKTFAKEKFRTLFQDYENLKDKNIDSWIGTNTILGTNPDDWAATSWGYLEEGPTPTGVILSGGFQSKKASGSDVGPKMIERKSYRKGDRGYTEDEKFLYLDLGKICSLPKYQGVKVLWISLGCGNHVLPYTPPALNRVEDELVEEVQEENVDDDKRVWGSDWTVNNYYYTNYTYTTQMMTPQQQFSYAGMSYQWGFNYNPCWWSPATYYPTNCWGCNSYVAQQPQTIINEGDTYITNEGDTYINEGDIVNEGDEVINEGDIIIVNNNNNNPPDVDDPDPDDDGGPVLPPNGDPVDDDGGPVLGDNGPVLGENGDGNGNNNDNDGGGNLGGSGMTTHDDEPLNQTTKNSQPATSSFSDIAQSSESKYWANSKDALLAQREQNQNGNNSFQQSKPSSPVNPNVNRTPPGNWSSPETREPLTAQNTPATRPPATNTSTTSNRTPQGWSGSGAQRSPSSTPPTTGGGGGPNVNRTPPGNWSSPETREPLTAQNTPATRPPATNTSTTSNRTPQGWSGRNPSTVTAGGNGQKIPSSGTLQRNPNTGGSKPPLSPVMNSGGGKVPTTTGQPAPQVKNPGGGMVSPARVGGGTAPAPAMGGGGMGGGRRR